MAVSPDQETIAQFTEITNVDHLSAITYLKSQGNNLENAINAFFGGQDRVESAVNEENAQYDEGAFSGGRQGELSQSLDFPAFQIDAGVVDSTVKNQNAAPSRPPSRNGHPRTDSVITIAPPDEYKEQFSNQVSGTVDSSQHVFGPASRPYYEPAQWAMTHPSSNSRELIPDLQQEDRKRAVEEPVLMKPLTFDDDLPSLISILGSIPGAFNTMCFKTPLLADYGYNPSWWQGSLIGASSPLVVDDEEAFSAAEELIFETQRLMAFIECTSRAYGSVEALSSLRLLQQVDKTKSSTKKLADRFLLAWDTAANSVASHQGLSKLFRSVAYQEVGEQVSYTPFWCFECTLENISEPWTLYDAVDSAIWSTDQRTNQNSTAYIQQAADIFVIRLIQPNTSASGLMISVPGRWYLDRYLPENAKVAKKMRLNMAQCRIRLSEITEMQNSLLQFHSLREGKAFDALSLLKTVISHFEQRDTPESFAQASDVANDPPPGQEQPADHTEITGQLRSAFDRIANKVQALEREKEALQKAYVEFSNLLKGPPEQDDQAPTHEYHLCGVATKPGVTYLLQSDREAKTQDDDSKSWQWWRMEYLNEPKVTKVKIDETDVLHAAQSESRRAMLVYAKPDVLFTEKQKLPQQLMDFVTKDNDAFATEEEIWKTSGENKSRDWVADWGHVPKDWPGSEVETEKCRSEHESRTVQSNKAKIQKSSPRQMPKDDEIEEGEKGSKSDGASGDAMDISSRSETKHVEYA